MKHLFIAMVLAAIPIYGQDVIAKDTNGIIVEVKEKYGSLLIDTCTVLMHHNGQFILVGRDGGSGWFPSSFHSVRVVSRIPASGEQLAKDKVIDEVRVEMAAGDGEKSTLVN